jgi:hypothetical protein
VLKGGVEKGEIPPLADIATLKRTLEDFYDKNLVRVRLLRLREEGYLRDGTKGRSAELSPRHAAVALLACTVKTEDARSAASEALRVGRFKARYEVFQGDADSVRPARLMRRHVEGANRRITFLHMLDQEIAATRGTVADYLPSDYDIGPYQVMQGSLGPRGSLMFEADELPLEVALDLPSGPDAAHLSWQAIRDIAAMFPRLHTEEVRPDLEAFRYIAERSGSF